MFTLNKRDHHESKTAPGKNMLLYTHLDKAVSAGYVLMVERELG